MTDALLTVKEVAELLRVSRRTVERERKVGHLRSVTIGRRRLFTEREVQAYISSRRAA